MDKQYRLFEDDTKWDVIQFRVDPEMKTDIHIWCKQHQIPVSVFLRMVCGKVLSNRRSFPSCEKEATNEIRASVEDTVDVLPTINKQRKINSRMY